MCTMLGIQKKSDISITENTINGSEKYFSSVSINIYICSNNDTPSNFTGTTFIIVYFKVFRKCIRKKLHAFSSNLMFDP